MSKYDSTDLVIEVDNSSGTLVNLSQYIDTVNEFNVEAMLQETHAFGDAWVENMFTGMKRANPVTLEGFYDDTATVGPDAILNAIGDTRELKFTWGSTKTSLVNAVITTYSRTPTRGEITRFSCTLTPSGVVTEA